MKRCLIMIVTFALAVPSLGLAAGRTTYGDGITLDEAIAIETLLTKPADFVGKKVRVEGTITDVCKMRGCWMQLSDSKGKSIRVKVEDGVMVFPYTSKGHQAAAEGVFHAIKLTPEQIEARKAAAAEAHEGHGEGCDKAKKDGAKQAEHSGGEGAGCDAPAVDDTIYLIRGTGAAIES